jgi:hypothetical protein
MLCHRLAERIQHLNPDLPAIEVARICLLILNSGCDDNLLSDDARVQRECKAAAFRLKATADQHEAVTAELDMLCQDGPQKFDADQIWTLVRAIKVQSQILDLYTDQPAWT